MEKAKRARKAETPRQPSLCLRLRAPYLYPDPTATPALPCDPHVRLRSVSHWAGGFTRCCRPNTTGMFRHMVWLTVGDAGGAMAREMPKLSLVLAGCIVSTGALAQDVKSEVERACADATAARYAQSTESAPVVAR
jgi:hypothetical protein